LGGDEQHAIRWLTGKLAALASGKVENRYWERGEHNKQTRGYLSSLCFWIIS
jgi:hypothetical protein